jgi:hypothetical protein
LGGKTGIFAKNRLKKVARQTTQEMRLLTAHSIGQASHGWLGREVPTQSPQNLDAFALSHLWEKRTIFAQAIHLYSPIMELGYPIDSSSPKM